MLEELLERLKSREKETLQPAVESALSFAPIARLLFRSSGEFFPPSIPIMLLLQGIEDPRFLGPLLHQMAKFPTMFEEDDPTLRMDPIIGMSKSTRIEPLFSDLRLKTLLRFTEPLNMMLKKAESEHLYPLTPDQRRALLLPLKIPSFDVELTLRVLKALELVGGMEAWPVVERLARGDFYLFGTDEPISQEKEAVRQAARKCLPQIMRNMEEAQKASVLLRPSVAQAAPEILLRPVATTVQSPASELLRPTDSGREEENS